MQKEILNVKSWIIASKLQDAECERLVEEAKAFEIARRIHLSGDDEFQELGPESEDEIMRRVVSRQEANSVSSSESENQYSRKDEDVEDEDDTLREWYAKRSARQLKELIQDGSSSSELEGVFSDEEDGTKGPYKNIKTSVMTVEELVAFLEQTGHMSKEQFPDINALKAFLAYHAEEKFDAIERVGLLNECRMLTEWKDKKLRYATGFSDDETIRDTDTGPSLNPRFVVRDPYLYRIEKNINGLDYRRRFQFRGHSGQEAYFVAEVDSDDEGRVMQKRFTVPLNVIVDPEGKVQNYTKDQLSDSAVLRMAEESANFHNALRAKTERRRLSYYEQGTVSYTHLTLPTTPYV